MPRGHDAAVAHDDPIGCAFGERLGDGGRAHEEQVGHVAVGAAGARELIEADLTKKGYIPGKDAWFVC